MGDVADAEGDGIGVELRIRRTADARHRRRPMRCALRLSASARRTPSPSMSAIDVADRDRRPRRPAARAMLGDAEGDVAGAARHIQHAPAGLRVQPFHHRILPDAVDAARHQIVHQVVARRDRGKDLAHKAFLFGLRHVAEAEAGGFVCRSWPDHSAAKAGDGLDKSHARTARSRDRAPGPAARAGRPHHHPGRDAARRPARALSAPISPSG